MTEREKHLKTMRLAMTETYCYSMVTGGKKLGMHLAVTETYNAAVWLHMVKTVRVSRTGT
jgi:hypothetical protein